MWTESLTERRCFVHAYSDCQTIKHAGKQKIEGRMHWLQIFTALETILLPIAAMVGTN